MWAYLSEISCLEKEKNSAVKTWTVTVGARGIHICVFIGQSGPFSAASEAVLDKEKAKKRQEDYQKYIHEQSTTRFWKLRKRTNFWNTGKSEID